MSNPGEYQKLELSSQEIFNDDNKLKVEDFSYSYYDEDTNNLLFDPCVYYQRYQRVFDILINMRWRKHVRKITEYGCGDFKLMKFFKHFLSLRKVNFVDIDEIVLKEKLSNLKICDYHYSNRRFNPLHVNVFEGSIEDPDERVLDSDVVIGIEIIEHLFPDTLEAVPYVIFQSIKPKIVIFTTPNADFNVALPNFKKFRHPDHKFEWTREQFQSWCSNITLRFPEYNVVCLGVGKGPKGTEHLGCCSQLALFVRKDILDHSNQQLTSNCTCGAQDEEENCEKCNPKKPLGICTYMTASKKFTCIKENDLRFYKHIYKTDYQYIDDDNRTDEEKLLEIMRKNISYQAPVADGCCFIPLHKIISTYNLGVLISEEEAESILIRYGYNVKKCFVSDDIGSDVCKWKRCVEFLVQKEDRRLNHPLTSRKFGTAGRTRMIH
ncbi:small RNA 2'-O-methyltransferase-like [Coccinella septempunctata]|uniref:small RNA 2'-O-methyltransferase-like n=1 Tax=Coccinella septempunctata TaxID=41139 RepID=UPI001D092974|nr:small RNA 2'-O-methyltransferase-like [Coccinella septempunctata]